MSAGASAGAAAAAAAAKRKREEEESMATYQGGDLEGWEFKIVRSSTGAFRKRHVIERVCAEEAEAGWELVEKFDNGRLRFKRKTEERSRDRQREIDPYRTWAGLSEGALGGLIVAAVVGALLLVFVVIKAAS